MRGAPPVLMMRGAKLSLMLRNGKLFPAALARGRPLPTPKPLSPPPNPLNNLQSLILIACLLACFLGVVQSKPSLLGGDPSLNYQESTKLFTAQQEVLEKSGSGTSFTSFASSFLFLFPVSSATWAEDDLPFQKVNCCGGCPH